MGLEEDGPVRIQDVHAISSFNKIASNQIAVPGVPPRLHPITERLDLQLDYDNKSLGRDYPTYTHHFEPLVRSIEATDPNYDLRQTDIVTNASNLRKMFMIFHNKQQNYERYDLTWRNDTLFLSKWTSDPYLNSSLGHGTGFEQATCIYDDQEDDLLKSSASHHRVIQYRFGGLQLVVQSEIDAYHCDCHRPSNFDPTLPETLSALTVDEVSQYQRRSSAVSAGSSKPSTHLSVFSSSSLDACHRDSHTTGETPPSSPPPSPCRPLFMDKTPGPCVPGHLSTSPSNPSATLRVLHLGRDIPSHCLVEVKTHKVRNKPLFNAEAQLYFSQIHKLYIAKNDNGRFFPSGSGYNNSVVEEDKSEEIRLWADTEQNQRTLKKVVALLKKIRELARQMEKEKGVRTITLLMKCDGMGMESGREGRERGGVKVTLYERRDSMEEEGTGGCLPGEYLDYLGGDGDGERGEIMGVGGEEGVGRGGGLEDGLEDGMLEDRTLYDWGVGGLGFGR
ncbi:hypothetical protein NEUTE1DRAFT_141239 [Neurospora tetrasperma FGSC 2508]|uniref:Uncharacterized protein n=1 Tax=Neurospora tetrasperma (strain FGSC 2508 / ATCC MYA-4615 / P0657) TaxID=510951 RepID=F8MXW0_NEUT8|nr:uncharacterized protein NEUTE1DRAFT_141239 [Neurospora tetrasperma FGSC 2508]EGO53864.1 hypothetical protein NEUTE1DRAFT_141239 [Neurospora tetrasperma FGSC 2508]EGZ72423.1 hypothetical protein NEUTE2DRAFT_139423 [Neurospora tetrasperma FGSC 2509]